MFNPTPLWVWLYGEKESRMEDLLWDLEDEDSGALDSYYTTYRIKLHQMDFATGATSSSMVQYYKPDRKTDFQVKNTSLDPKNPKDDMYLSMLEKKNNPDFDGLKLHQQLRKSFSKYITHSPNGRRAGPGWQFINPEEGGDLYNSNDKHGFIIDQGAASVSASASHQVVIMNSEDCYKINTPSTGEIIVLLRWMLAAVKPQKSKSSISSRKYAENCLFQHDIPTMVISFLPDSKVRILYGYFDGGRLRIAHTKAIAFDNDHYEENMDTLLQWTWPIICKDTSKPLPMQTIEESDESDESDQS
ncbi:uncharacterized protein N7511_000745 [Penicillium nucicola]|uniref:uncharacterized protein n=1 Tax=Penicillium nucicola TaxID=1850975 RepID=UPI0025453B7B|nr:uncharacterized protein N7511_000745 [Penicillium nucicola]KAJ5775734.1 hypothetical protein N7511_000745 [Penicillium nucicola]